MSSKVCDDSPSFFAFWCISDWVAIPSIWIMSESLDRVRRVKVRYGRGSGKIGLTWPLWRT